LRQGGQGPGLFFFVCREIRVGETVPFWGLRDDVIKGSPLPKLPGYQQGTPGVLEVPMVAGTRAPRRLVTSAPGSNPEPYGDSGFTIWLRVEKKNFRGVVLNSGTVEFFPLASPRRIYPAPIRTRKSTVGYPAKKKWEPENEFTPGSNPGHRKL